MNIYNQMDYKRIHDQIIIRAKTRQLEGYKEQHHIIPRCMGGTNNKDNLVNLTAREHFLIHMLLCEIYPKNNKLYYAIWLMSIGKQKYNNGKYMVSSRLYERLKLEFSKRRTGIKRPPVSEETRKKISLAIKGKIMSQETKDKISKANKGRQIFWADKMRKPKPLGTGDKISISLKGRKIKKETREKISNSKKGTKLSEDTKNKISDSNKGKPKHNEESKLKLRNIHLGKILSQNTKDKINTKERALKISKSNTGKKRTKEAKLKQSLAKLGKLSNAAKPIIQFTLDNFLIKEWPSITEAKKRLGKGDIQGCVLGRTKTAGGYIWKYKQ